jgi:hypothetical protein
MVVFSCGDSSNTKDSSSTTKEAKETIYFIEGEDITLRRGPGESFDKIVNEKATKMLKETRYVQVDPSEDLLFFRQSII